MTEPATLVTTPKFQTDLSIKSGDGANSQSKTLTVISGPFIKIKPTVPGQPNPDYAYPSELISIGCSELSSFSQFCPNANSAQSFPYPMVTFSVSF
jgi:hypothetical protein